MVVVWVGCQGGGFPLRIGFGLPGGVAFACFGAFSWCCLPARRFVSVLGALAFPCFVSGLLVLPLCGAALTFFAAAKKDKQRKRLEAPAKRVPQPTQGSGASGIWVRARA